MFKKKAKLSQESGVEARDSEIESLQEKNNKFQSCNLHTLGTVNELLQFMTTLDYVKEMIMDANQQSSMVENVAASSQEMSAATEDISNYVEESNKTMQHTLAETEKNLQKIDSTFSVLENNMEQTNEVKAIMDEVIGETDKINDMVSIIKAVADQTNLLALNASIEAARAGEHGRGFAVVADEIKKLADNTRQQVGNIQATVNSLNGKVSKTSNEIDRVIQAFAASKVAMNEATQGIKGIGTSMSSVGASFTEISANIEEQTAASQEMSSNLMIINEKSLKLKGEAGHTGQAFFDISQKIDAVRLKALNTIEGLDSLTMIELTITDHLMWKWRVYNMILGYTQLKVETVGDHKGCRLGQWLSTLDRSNTKINDIMRNIEEPHAKIHETAKKVIMAYNNKNIAEAERLLKEIEVNSTKVVDCLGRLKNVIE